MKKYLFILPLNSVHARNELLLRIAHWALRFSPIASISSEQDGVILDLTGTDRLFSCELKLAQHIREELAAHSIKAKVAVAPNIGAAWALARFRREDISIVQKQHLRQELLPLPIQALRLNDETICALQQLGIRTLEAIFKLPRKNLALRFGTKLITRMDQITGAVDEKSVAIAHPVSLTLRRGFEPPLQNSARVKDAALILLKELLQRLEAANVKAAAFAIETQALTPAGAKITRCSCISLHSAIGSFSAISMIIDSALESNLPGGLVELIAITPQQLEPLRYKQRFLGSANEAADTLAAENQLLNHLTLGLGALNLRQLALNASHLPELSFAYTPLDRRSGARPRQTSLQLPRGRPALLLNPPEPLSVTALLPDNPPARIGWRGAEYRIICSHSSEKICSEWWASVLQPGSNESDSERHYFSIQDHTGRWLWVFRNRELRWFVHGIWA